MELGASREVKWGAMTMPPLDLVLRHNAWANTALLEFCTALDPAQLDMQAAGTYGTLYGVVQHIVGAEQWYLSLLTGEVIGPPVRRDERRALDDLRFVSAATGARAQELAAREDGAREVTVVGKRATVAVVLAQLVNHGNEHRTHAATILSLNGVESPVLSAWAYGAATGLSDAKVWE